MGTKDGVDGKERGDINIHYSSCAISMKEKKKIDFGKLFENILIMTWEVLILIDNFVRQLPSR